MCKYPISSFLFWKIREENKKEWISYEFLTDYDKEHPHNKEADLSGVNNDVYFVLDGQQRLTSLYIGLKGSYRYFYYSWHKTNLYLNLLKQLDKNPENPEEPRYMFKFREPDVPNNGEENEEFWYKVGDILDHADAEDAKDAIKNEIQKFTEDQQAVALRLIGQLHSVIHTHKTINFYEESQISDYDTMVEIFVRTNTGGVKLEYSDILLSTATAKWKTKNAREEIYNFTDEINRIGIGYNFGKDFVMKGAMYLTDGLPIQYKISSFTKKNLEKIEDNWDTIKNSISTAVKLIHAYGFTSKNILSALALLPIAYYVRNMNVSNWSKASDKISMQDKNNIQKWLVIVMLRNVFGGSSDTTLKNLQSVLIANNDGKFPYQKLNEKVSIQDKFSSDEIENFLMTNYATKYSFLVLSLLYPDRDWLGNSYSQDHIFPKSEFTEVKLRKRGYPEELIIEYRKYYNTIYNLELLEETENKSKSNTEFEAYLLSRDANFKKRHCIPDLTSYGFDYFLDFIKARKKMLIEKLSSLSFEE